MLGLYDSVRHGQSAFEAKNVTMSRLHWECDVHHQDAVKSLQAHPRWVPKARADSMGGETAFPFSWQSRFASSRSSSFATL
eukprot:1627062-Amphidinium_carterae.1